MSQAVEMLRTLYEYSGWARDRVLDAANRLDAAQLQTPIPGVYGSIHETLVHMAVSQWMWFERIQGRSPHEVPTGDDFADLAQLRAWWDTQHMASLAYLATLADTDLDRVIQYTNTLGQVYTRRVWHALLQVVNHQTEHRSQVAAMLTQQGVEAPATDLVVFLRQG
jgi:uncharacterized damage-inducible protein DinB